MSKQTRITFTASYMHDALNQKVSLQVTAKPERGTQVDMSSAVSVTGALSAEPWPWSVRPAVEQWTAEHAMADDQMMMMNQK